MISKTKLLSVAAIGLIIINLALLAFLFFSQPGPPPGGRLFPPEEGPKRFIIQKLQLDKQQEAAYEILITEHITAVRALEEEIRQSKNNLYLNLNNGSTAVKDSLINRLSGLQKQIEETHYRHFEEIKKLCHPQQMEGFNDLTKELAHLFNAEKKLPPPPKD